MLSHTCSLSPEDEILRIEFLWVLLHFCGISLLTCARSEIKAQYLFEKETSEKMFPQWQDGSFMSDFRLVLHGYLSLLKARSMFSCGTLSHADIQIALLYRVGVATV